MIFQVLKSIPLKPPPKLTTMPPKVSILDLTTISLILEKKTTIFTKVTEETKEKPKSRKTITTYHTITIQLLRSLLHLEFQWYHFASRLLSLSCCLFSKLCLNLNKNFSEVKIVIHFHFWCNFFLLLVHLFIVGGSHATLVW